MNKRKPIRPLSGSEAEKAREKSVRAALERKILSADQLRRLWARASSAKRHILQVLAPELLELRARHDALEALVLDCADLRGFTPSEPEALQENLLQRRKKALRELPDSDRLQHLAGDARDAVWKGVEDRMVNDIYGKQKSTLLRGIGVFNGEKKS